MKLIPYLYFPGNTEEAMNFYSEVFGGSITALQRFSDGPTDMPVPEGFSNKIMHGRVGFGDCEIYFSDGHSVEGKSPHSMTIEFDDTETQNSVYARLSEGGKVHFELQDTFWGARFGKLADKYGMNWDLNYQYPQKG